MAAINLEKRVTADLHEFERCRLSPASKILIAPSPTGLDKEPVSLDLTVGNRLFDQRDNATYELSSGGFRLRRGRSVVLQSNEELRIPENLFGLITGRGALIFKGVLISPGKIDPSFEGHLYVAVFNAGRETVVLERGAPFCSCSFFDFDVGVETAPRRPALTPTLGTKPPRSFTRLWTSLRLNFATVAWILALLIAGASLIVTLVKK